MGSLEHGLARERLGNRPLNAGKNKTRNTKVNARALCQIQTPRLPSVSGRQPAHSHRLDFLLPWRRSKNCKCGQRNEFRGERKR